jgi:2-polyprenyl-3-methyl-5-hydroxy-6-metoxy-1,4-benzoquinol methylase
MDCCRPDYETVFSDARAKNDLKRYRKKGPDTTTRLLIEALTAAGVRNRTLLDIGGGIGAVDHELLAAGAASAVHVEASEPFVRAATEEAARRGHAAKLTSRRGDFVELAGDIAPADVVTLDRVICCYAEMDQLVSASAAHARQLYGIVVPRERMLTRLMRMGINAVFRVTRNPFRFFIHPIDGIERILARYGLARVSSSDTLIWKVAVYARAAGAATGTRGR